MIATIVNMSVNAVQFLALIAVIVFVIATIVAAWAKNLYGALIAGGLAFTAGAIMYLA